MHDIFVGRQPILDRNGELAAYELLFRPGQGASPVDGVEMTASVVVNTLLDIGLDRISNGMPVYINTPEALLLKDALDILPPGRVHLEILEDVEVTDALLAACRRLKSLGYTILLDDFEFAPHLQPLVELADIIKVDILAIDDLAAEVKKLSTHPVVLLAEKVETHEQYETALALGFSLFQGYYFCKPETIKGVGMPSAKVALLKAHQQVMATTNLDDIQHIIQRDLGLSYRLLKYLNSAALGIRQQIKSVSHAVILLGLNNIRHWLSLLTMVSIGSSKPKELIHMSLVRGHLLEDLADQLGQGNQRQDFFTLGMFSLLDAILDQPMEDIVDELALPDDLRAGLLGTDSRMGALPALAQALERGEYLAIDRYCEQYGIRYDVLNGAYLNALQRSAEYAAALHNAS